MKQSLLLSITLLTTTMLTANNNATLLCYDMSEHIVQDNAQKSTYKNCKRNGMTYWFSDQMKIKSQVNFVDDKEHGLYTSFYDNGKKRIEVNYTHGDKDGVQKIYYDTGVLGSQVTYKKGRREGLMIEWDEEGFKSSEVLYKNNYKVGLKKYYDHDGKVIFTKEYKMDRNPLMLKLLKDKRKEILIDLSKYGLVPKNASKEEKMR